MKYAQTKNNLSESLEKQIVDRLCLPLKENTPTNIANLAVEIFETHLARVLESTRQQRINAWFKHTPTDTPGRMAAADAVLLAAIKGGA